MKKDYMYKYPSNVVYYSNYPYMDRNSNYNSNDERFAGGFIGPFILGGITGGLVAPFFYGNGCLLLSTRTIYATILLW